MGCFLGAWNKLAVSWITAWAVAVLLFCPAPVSAAAKPEKIRVPKALSCTDAKSLEKLKDIRALNPEEKCKFSEPAGCNRLPKEEAKKYGYASICKGIYGSIQTKLENYESDVKRLCGKATEGLKACMAKKPSSKDFLICMSEHKATFSADQTFLAEGLKELQRKVLELEEKAKLARADFRKSRDAYHQSFDPGTHVNPFIKKGQSCAAWNDSDRKPDIIFKTSAAWSGDDSEGILIGEQTAAIKVGETFREHAYGAAETHEKMAKTAKEEADYYRGAALKAVTGGSDITGAPEKKNTGAIQPPPQIPQAGGGAPAGGASSAGGSGAVDQGLGGATSGTPVSKSASGGSQAKGEESGRSSPLDKGPKTDNEQFVTANTDPGSSPSGLAVGDSTASSRAPASASSRSGGKPATGRASGSSSGGGAETSAKAKDCRGKDCQQALGDLKTSQFASVGSLGGGMGADGLGSAASLDSLFGADPAKTDMAGGSLDALATSEGSFGEGLGSDDGALQAGGDDVGKADGRDLFLRVHVSYLRAQKRGNVAGIPKKL